MLNDLINTLLLKVYEEQQKVSANMASLSPVNLQVDMKSYAMAVDYLLVNGLINGAVIQEGGDEPGPFWATLSEATITPKGIKVLEALGMI